MPKFPKEYNETRYAKVYRWTIEIPLKPWNNLTPYEQTAVKNHIREILKTEVGE